MLKKLAAEQRYHCNEQPWMVNKLSIYQQQG
jgi:hypothetical protein